MTSFSAQLEARINDKLRVISYNRAYIEYSRGRNCHSFFFISTSKLAIIMRTLDPPHFYYGRRRFRVFELLLSCDLNCFPVSPSAFLFCHICGRANSTWTYYNEVEAKINHITILQFYTIKLGRLARHLCSSTPLVYIHV